MLSGITFMSHYYYNITIIIGWNYRPLFKLTVNQLYAQTMW